MSAFYGSIQGNRGAATRGGSKSSGYRASAQSWDGSIITDMWYNNDDELMVSIGINNGSSTYVQEEIFRGKFTDLKEAFKKISEVKHD